MPDSLGALYVIVLLLPGFVGYLALAKIYNRKIEDGFDKVALVVLVTALSLAIVGLFHTIYLPAAEAKLSGEGIRQFFTTTFPIQSVICVVVGIVLALIGNTPFFANLANRWGWSAKTGQAAVIAATIQRYPESYFRIHFKEGGYIVGHPRLYSLDGDEGALFLENAEIRRKRKKASDPLPAQVRIDAKGVLIAKYDDILYIEVV